jgi:formylglycine-generating enzyme required for sulfatase activity
MALRQGVEGGAMSNFIEYRNALNNMGEDESMKSRKEQNIVLRPLFNLVGFLLTLLVATTASAQVPSKTTPLQSFRDCPNCPEMVVIPAGIFLMGANKEVAKKYGVPLSLIQTKLPRHNVSVRSFAIAKNDVTKGEYARFVKETGYNQTGCKILKLQHDVIPLVAEWGFNGFASWRNPGFEQSDKEPVVCVSWDDAQRYISWLNSKVGETSPYRYRLPSDAEWEYAARAGTNTLRFWGDEATDQCLYANGRDFTEQERYPGEWYPEAPSPGYAPICKDGFATTSPVASFRPNQWGLYDMLGNVEQWIEDCSHSYEEPPLDYRECSTRIVRGGGWDAAPIRLMSYDHNTRDPRTRNSDLGFRLARDVKE